MSVASITRIFGQVFSGVRVDFSYDRLSCSSPSLFLYWETLALYEEWRGGECERKLRFSLAIFLPLSYLYIILFFFCFFNFGLNLLLIMPSEYCTVPFRQRTTRRWKGSGTITQISLLMVVLSC